MKTYLLIILIGLCSLLSAQAVLPQYYHTYDEILQEMADSVAVHSDIAKLDTLGYTEDNPWSDPIPIVAMKISDNVNTNENNREPGLLFIGQVHAEELTGVEETIELFKEIFANRGIAPYRQWIENLEIWFIPTINPAGHNVVVRDGLDVTYRKNMRDSNGDGTFSYVVQEGSDEDGVDLNRNYDFGWIHGERLLESTAFERYDYYRGSAPMSESELQALKAFCDEQCIVYSINWHSSRTGNFSKKVFFPWAFNGLPDRKSPDHDLSSNIGINVAHKIADLTGEWPTYQPSASEGRVGKSTQWFYAEYGTIQLTIETALIQPDSTELYTDVANCLVGNRWLINKALNFTPATETEEMSHEMLKVIVTDSETDEPLVAEVKILEKHSPYFTPRKTRLPHGIHWRPIASGTYTIEVSKKGYETQQVSATVNSNYKTVRVALEKAKPAVVAGTLESSGTPIDGEIIINGIYNDTIAVTNGTFSFDSYEGIYDMVVRADGHFPYIGTLNIRDWDSTSVSITKNMEIDLDTENIIFSDLFDTDLNQWTANGPWQLVDNAVDGMAVTDSHDDADGFYAPNCDVDLTTVSAVDLSAANNILCFSSHVYTEPDFDFCTVELSSDGANWEEIYSISGKHDTWNDIYVPIPDTYNGNYFMRFRLTDQSDTGEIANREHRLCDPGWTIDNLKIVSGNAAVLKIDDDYVPAYVNTLNQNYPNPFNPETTFAFSIKEKNVENASIGIYNIKGEKIETLELDNSEIQNGKKVWNADKHASGVYLYRLMVNGKNVETRKAILLK